MEWGEMDLVEGKTALLVIDMQNSFLKPEGAMSKLGFDCEKLREAIPGTERLVAGARAKQIPIIYTQYAYEPDFKDGGWLVEGIMPALREVNLCVRGSWDAEIIASLTPRNKESVVQKNRPSAFIATQLESMLGAMEIENLVVCGVTANMCVETTVRDACQRDIRTVVVKDAVAEVDDDRMKIAMMAMEFFFAKIMTVSEVLDSWDVELSNVS